MGVTSGKLDPASHLLKGTNLWSAFPSRPARLSRPGNGPGTRASLREAAFGLSLKKRASGRSWGLGGFPEEVKSRSAPWTHVLTYLPWGALHVLRVLSEQGSSKYLHELK